MLCGSHPLYFKRNWAESHKKFRSCLQTGMARMEKQEPASWLVLPSPAESGQANVSLFFPLSPSKVVFPSPLSRAWYRFLP